MSGLLSMCCAAGKPKRAVQWLQLAFFLVLMLGFPTCALLWFGTRYAVAMLTEEQAVIETAVTVNRLLLPGGYI